MTHDPALDIAIPLIATFEGFRSEPYLDPGGTATIGYGFTVLESGQHVTLKTPPITEPEARARLTAIVTKTMARVRSIVHAPITNNQAAALCSFAYNEGTNALLNSTLLRVLDQGKPEEAAQQFGAWIYAHNQPSEGLRIRRAMERALFLRPDEPTADDLNQAELNSLGVVP